MCPHDLLRRLLRPLPLVGLTLFAGLALSMALPSLLAGDEVVAAAASEPAPLSARARARLRCQYCGVVESITPVEGAGAQAASYEFRVRLRDGSARVSSLPSASLWRVGDRIMLMDGESP